MNNVVLIPRTKVLLKRSKKIEVNFDFHDDSKKDNFERISVLILVTLSNFIHVYIK